MLYRYSATVTKNTTEATLEKTTIPLAAGEIVHVSIGFPWGCAGLVHVRIYRAEHQVWPSNPDESFAWNDYNVEFREALTTEGPTEEWSIRAWNEDVRHDHTIVVRVNILPPEKTTLGSIAQSLFGRARR